MADRTRHRPRRGEPGPNVLITGDTGIYGGPQGGEKPGASESGDLEAREFGVPQADIPGGLVHMANAEAVVTRTPDKARRPADYHKYHGVPSDDGQYTLPPGTEHDHPLKAEPEPREVFAVPVYEVERPDGTRTVRKLITEGPQAIASGTTDPVRIADRDPDRVNFYICNETTAAGAGQSGPAVRVGDWETCADNRGLLIPAATLQKFESQDAVYVTNQSGSTVTISFGYETEIPAAGV